MANPAAQALAAISSRQYELVATILDAAELEATNPAVFVDWPHALHLLGHLYNKNLNDARFLWKRIPANAKQDAELQAVWKLMQHLWQRHYSGVWPLLEGVGWSAGVAPFIQALAVKLRAELLDLIATAYSSVRPAKVAAICGMQEPDAIKVCVASGWVLNSATGTLSVPQKTEQAEHLEEAGNLHSLAEYMVHLDQ